jgi:hypothetical protein
MALSTCQRWPYFRLWKRRRICGRISLVARIMHVFADVAPGQFLEPGETVDLAPGEAGRTKDGATFA